MVFPTIYNTYFVAFIATVGGMLFGFDISSISAIINSDQYLAYFDTPTGITQGAIGSALAAGSVVGSIIAGPVSNLYGRKISLYFACCWWLVGTAIQTGCNGVGSLIAGRVINGVCVGITSSQVPVYLAEIAKKEVRGSLVIIQQLAIGMSPGLSIESMPNWTNLRRMGYSDHVLYRLWLYFHSWPSIFPHRMGDTVCTLHAVASWLTFHS